MNSNVSFLCSPFYHHVQQFVSQLENTQSIDGSPFISHTKAENIRNQMTVVYDRENKCLVDLLNQQPPREEAALANSRLDERVKNYHEIIKSRKVQNTFEERLPSKILKRRDMAPLLELFPNIDLSNLQIIVCGEAGDPSYYIDGRNGSKNIIAVSPDLYGLSTQIVLNIVDKNPYFGFYPNVIGSELIGACAELIAQEEIPPLVGVAWFVQELVEPLGYNPRLLAKEFILGNPSELFAALQKAHPLAPALLTFISETPDDTETGICRLTVMETLGLCGKEND